MEILGPKTPVIVAGGASGVGYGTCLALAEHGRAVSVWDIQADAAKATAAECPQHFGVPTDFQVVDLADAEALETSVAAALKTLGGVGGTGLLRRRERLVRRDRIVRGHIRPPPICWCGSDRSSGPR